MKTLTTKLLLFIMGCMLLTGMKCEKDNPQSSNEQLPAITQTGANTFGFLLNGEVWLPKAPLLRQKLDLSYDPNYNGGTFNIIAKRYYDNENYDHISMGGLSVSKTGIYDLFVAFNDGQCYYYEIDKSKPVGTLTITKIDLTNKFISGTFEFKLEKDGCPIINAAQGRFDLKIE